MLTRPAHWIALALVVWSLIFLGNWGGGSTATSKPDVQFASRTSTTLAQKRGDAPFTQVTVTEDRAPAASSGMSAEDKSGAQEPAAGSSGSAFAPSNELLGAERLAIKFQGYAELSGEYRLSGDGSISVPVIGRLNISGMQPQAVEKALAQRVTRLTGRDTYVTVEVLEYRGVFVSGYVARPGSFPWRPRMTVLHALALAGGTFRGGSDASSGASLEEDAVLERLQKAISNQKRNLAALARIEAERSRKPSFDAPPKLISLVGREQSAEVIEAERTALISRNAAFEAKKTALARATEMAGRELAGLTEQSKRLDVQLVARRTYKSKIDSLQEKGIVRAERSMDEYTRVSDLEDRKSTVSVAIARVQATLAELERDRVNLEYERKAELDQESIKLNRQIAELDIGIEAERARYRKITGADPPLSLIILEPPKKSTLSYKVVRQTVQGAANLNADQSTELRPDDILVISME